MELPDATAVSIQSDVLTENGSSSSSPAAAAPTQASSSANASPKTISLSTLPPILLDVCIPASYPYTAPQIRTIHATHSWLSLTRFDLRGRLAEMWEEGEGVLYNWVEWIRSGDFLDALGLSSTVDGRRIIRYVMRSCPAYYTLTDFTMFIVAFHIRRRVCYSPYSRSLIRPHRRPASPRIPSSAKYA